MDYNGAIHQSAQKVLKDTAPNADITDSERERSILDGIWKYTNTCVNVVRPSGTVHICIDGVAPTAKMIQQRKRRYMSMFTKKLERGIVRPSSTPAPIPMWDSNAISPGTPFMARLQAYLRACIRDDFSKNYNLSGSDDPGEGEHKIFARIAALDHKDPIVVYGLDADLIMLSLMSHHPSIFLMREPTGPYREQETADGFLFMDIDVFRCALLRELQIKFKWPVTDEMINDPYGTDARKMIETYVCVCFFLGNDFLPHPLTLSLKKGGHEAVLFAAKNCMEQGLSFWDAQDNPNNAFMMELLAILSKNEDDDVWKVNQDYLKRRPHSTLADNIDSYPMQPQYKHPFAKILYDMKATNKWRGAYYKTMFHTRMFDTSVIRLACTFYIQGIHWTYRYYKRLPKDPRWYYPYGYPPTLRDLQNFVGSLSEAENAALLSKFTTPPSHGFVTSDTQLLCIMPKASYSILPKKVQKIMINPEYGCTHMYPTDYQVQTYLKTHLWECTPVLPWIDLQQIQDALETI